MERMEFFQIKSPSRLHFGLLACGPQAPRRFGGAGLMIEKPGLRLGAQYAAEWSATGPLAERALQIARSVERRWGERGQTVAKLRLEVMAAPPEHMGLGTGTQLSMAVAQVVSAASGIDHLDAELLGKLSGRGLRSGIGLHGFLQGGLIVDGGRRSAEGIPPLVARLTFPENWKILLVMPGSNRGLHGHDEDVAFQKLPAMPDAVSDRLCRLVLLGLVPAIVERDLASFGAALTAIQFHVGQVFAPVQGGRLYTQVELEPLIGYLRNEHLAGPGQSSWGPTVYAFAEADPEREAAITERLIERFPLRREQVVWTNASNRGFELCRRMG